MSKRTLTLLLPDEKQSCDSLKKYKNNHTYSRSELSSMIQWLIDLAGTDCIIQEIINKFTTCKNIKINNNLSKLPLKPSPKTIYYLSSDSTCGHWVYVSSDKKEYNSYKLDHQNPGSNQFCQSFAIMYMLFDVGKSSLSEGKSNLSEGKSNLSEGKSSLSEGKSNLLGLQPSLSEGHVLQATNIDLHNLFQEKLEWSDYIIKIVNMWEYFLNNGLKDIIISESVRINTEYKEYNLKNKRLTAQYLTFEQDANGETELNANWIRYKLQKIKENAEQIAINT